MRETVICILCVIFLCGFFYICFKGGKAENERKEICDFICYKKACQDGQLNQIVHSECVESKWLGECIFCRCSSSIVPVSVEN